MFCDSRIFMPFWGIHFMIIKNKSKSLKKKRVKVKNIYDLKTNKTGYLPLTKEKRIPQDAIMQSNDPRESHD